MSVPVRKRNLSSLEFYNTAVMIYKDIISILDKLPRKLVDPTNHEVDRIYLIDFYQKAFLKTYEDMMLNIDLANEILQKAKDKGVKLLLPVDHAVADNFDAEEPRAYVDTLSDNSLGNLNFLLFSPTTKTLFLF